MANEPLEPNEQTPADTGSGSHAARGAAGRLADQQKTVISKRAPIEEKPLPRKSTPVEMGRVLEGERLGHFQLEEFVGGGGMGAVFRAIDTMLGRTVAVKVVSRDQTDPDTLRRFQNEAQSAARLDHENIARVYYVGEDKGWNYIVFEFIEGVNVRDLVEHKGPLSLDEAVGYTLQVAEALEHAAHRDVVHRDIKPSNILITPEGRAKLVDMGLARLHQVESSADDLTASGVTLGTFDYISPEQARDPRGTDVRSDLYSLGCTFYYMLTGLPPFPEGTVLQKLLSHSTDPPPDPRQYQPELPEEVSGIIGKMMAKNPKDRYQVPSELIAQVMLLADQLDLTSVSHSGRVWIAPHQAQPSWLERHLPWAVPVLALVAVVVFLEWFLPTHPPEEGPAPVLLLGPMDDQSSVTDSEPQAESPDEDPLAPDTPDQPTERQPAVRPVAGTREDSVSGDKKTPDEQASESPPAGDPEPEASDLARLVEHFTGPIKLSQPGLEGGVSAVPPHASGASLGNGQAAGLSDVVDDAEPAGDTSPRLLIVGADDATTPDQVQVVDSLAAALQAAAELPDLEAIELHFNGARAEQPIKVAPGDLTIRAGAGYAPLIVFKPEPEELDEAKPSMIRMTGGRLQWQGVHFRLEVSELRESWALFRLEEIERLDLQDCTLTIRAILDQGTVHQDQVAFFDIVGSNIPGQDQQDDSAEPAGGMRWPLINMARCIARGQATLVRAEEVVPFRLRWEQGLLATTERLVEISGAKTKLKWYGRVNVALFNVVAFAERGLCLMKVDQDAPYQLPFSKSGHSSIFMTNPTAPLLEHKGAGDLEEVKKRVQLEGKDNFYQYDNADTLLRIDSGDQQQVATYTFEQRGDLVWDETDYGSMVLWKRLPPADRPVDRHGKEDYVLDPSIDNPAATIGTMKSSLAGFDPNLLPDFPPDGGDNQASKATDSDEAARAVEAGN